VYRRMLIAVVSILLAVVSAPSAHAGQNLLRNPGLSAGTPGFPDAWVRTQARGVALFYVTPPGAPAELAIVNSKLAFADWRQDLYLEPGWYHVSAEIRTEGVGYEGAGAFLAALQFDGLPEISERVRGDPGWQQVGFYLREDRWGDTTAIVCALGVASAPDSGRAWFRNIAVQRVAAPAPTGERAFDLAAIRAEMKFHPAPEGGIDRAIGAVTGLMLLTLVAWGLAALVRDARGADRRASWCALAIIIALTVAKFALLPYFPGFHYDITMKTDRSLLLLALGPARIYDPHLPVDFYPPGSLYPLWLSGWIGHLLMPGATGFRVLVEAPALVADALVALAVFLWARRFRRGMGALAPMLLLALNPALLYDSVVWGQSDAVMALPLLVGALLIVASRWRLGWALAALAVLIKPQAGAAIPVLVAWTLANAPVAEWIAGAGAGAATVAVGWLPFQWGHPAGWIFMIYGALGNRFKAASQGAFNLLALLGGTDVSDRSTVAGVSYFSLGMMLFAAALALAIWLVLRARRMRGPERTRIAIYGVFLALFGMFMFAPRMHERYVYGALVMLAPIAFDDWGALGLYTALTATTLANLLVIKWLADRVSRPDRWDPVLLGCSAVNLAIFAAGVYYALRLERAARAPAPSAAGATGAEAPAAAAGGKSRSARRRHRRAPHPPGA
jgi:Gpi18-like mannosyltransferase